MSRYFLIRPSATDWFPGTAPCSGTPINQSGGESLEVASMDDIQGTPATGEILRWCFSPLSEPGVGRFQEFPVTAFVTESQIQAATITVIVSYTKVSRHEAQALLGLPPTSTDDPSTYDSAFSVNFDGIGQASGLLVNVGGDSGSASVTVDLVSRGVLINTCDWSKLRVDFAVNGSVSSAFMTWAGNFISITDCLLHLKVPGGPAGGLSFSSTHGSGGGFIGSTNSLSI